MRSSVLYFETGSYFLAQLSYSKPPALASGVLGFQVYITISNLLSVS